MPWRQELMWLLIVAFLGALSTVISAWVCVAVCDPYRQPMVFNNDRGADHWSVTRGETSGALFVHSLRVRVTGPFATGGMFGPSLPVYQPIGAQVSPWDELSVA